ncbi:hypothetical protein [Varibaculum massiliense]|uniref:hypothetical protein n=1 Tax=Varibaculum massiliense TaxID=1852372 RepID=UPI0028898A0E|nr:hypothetical protein [Varibaculum massiliense]
MKTDEELLAEIAADPEPEMTITDPALIKVYQALVETVRADKRLDEAVRDAREQGQTWQAIGEIIGMTRQGTMKKFAA